MATPITTRAQHLGAGEPDRLEDVTNTSPPSVPVPDGGGGEPGGGGGGGGPGDIVRVVNPPSVLADGEGGGGSGGLSAEEAALLGALTDILRIQQRNMQLQADLFEEFLPEMKGLFRQQNALAMAQLDSSLRLLPERERAYLGSLQGFEHIAAEEPTIIGKTGRLTGADLVSVYRRYIGHDPSQAEIEEHITKNHLSWENMPQFINYSRTQFLGLPALAREDFREARTPLDLVGQAPTVSPEQRQLLDQIYGEQERKGIQGLRQFAEEMAASRGLRLTDSPIGEQVLPQVTELERGLGAERAATELGLGQEQQRFEAGLLTQQQGFQEAIRQFQKNLQMSALQNRAALATGGGLGGGGGGGSMPTMGGDGSATGAAASLFGTLQSGRQFQQSLAQARQLADLNRQTSLDVAGMNRPRSPSFLQSAAPIVGLGLLGLAGNVNWGNVLGGSGGGGSLLDYSNAGF